MFTFNKISTQDQVFAKLETNGKVIVSISKSNFSCVEDVVRFVSSLAGHYLGLAKLTIRNKTQGWLMNMALAAPLKQ